MSDECFKLVTAHEAERSPPRDASADSPVRVRKLFLLFGLKRSGLHAVAWWILAHHQRHVLINNSPRKIPGPLSPMMRTDRRSPLPVQVRVGGAAHALVEGREHPARLPRQLELMVVLFQSQSLSWLAEQASLMSGVEAIEVRPCLLLRDPLNWAASFLHKADCDESFALWPQLWIEYAREYAGDTNYLGDTVPISYRNWFTSPLARRELAERLGLPFSDAGLNVVTDHAGGSSFDQRSYDGRAQQMPVLDRWQVYRDDPQFIESLQGNLEVGHYARRLGLLDANAGEYLGGLGV